MIGWIALGRQRRIDGLLPGQQLIEQFIALGGQPDSSNDLPRFHLIEKGNNQLVELQPVQPETLFRATFERQTDTGGAR